MIKAPSRRVSRGFLLMVYLSALALAMLYGIFVFTDYDTSALNIGRSAASTNSCAYACRESRLEPAQIHLLEQSLEPIAYIIGSSQGAKVIRPGQCICVRAVVPPKTTNNTAGFIQKDYITYQPIPKWPIDSIMVDLVMQESTDNEGRSNPLYRDARVTVSVDMRAIAKSLDHSTSRIYEGAAQLFDPGLYALDAQIEQRDGRWNAELQQYSPEYENAEMQTTLPNNQFVYGKVKVLLDPRHPTYLKHHQNLPLCKDGDTAGRWIPEQNLPTSWKPWQYMRPVEDGRVWLPYHCRLRRISHAEFVFHMSRNRPSIHWYGDSNSRRTLRPFIMGGKWCHEANTTARLDCLCNDAPRDLFPDEWYSDMPVPHWYRVHTAGVNGSEVFMDLRLQQRQPTDPRPILDKDPSDLSFGPDYIPPGYRLRNDYFDLSYQFTRGTLDMYGSYWKRDITHASVSRYPVANLVVFQMVTWDASFGTYKNFERQVPQLVNRLRAVYPHTEFIYRSGPYWCCRNAEDQTKKYSRLRFQAFDALAKKYFQQKLGARVWDVANLARQRPPESKRLPENMPCRSAHSRAEQIHLDNQIFMNMLVNKS